MKPKMLEKSLTEVISFLKSNPLSQAELLNSCYKRIEAIKSLNAFTSVIPKKLNALDKPKSSSDILRGIPYAVKDNFSTRNIPTTCASVMLKNYTPSYDATVVEKLISNGGVMVGKTNLDEFAMGAGTVDSLFGPARNPWAYDFDDDTPPDWHVAGGSSGGSAIAVATGASYFAIGSDTGGSVRLPASFCGVVGLKPTYGSISRHGLISLVNSMDAPGIFTRTVDDAAFVFNLLSGHDEKDSTTVQREKKVVELKEETSVDGLVIGIPKEYHGPHLSPEVLDAWRNAADKFSKAGAIVKQVSLPHTQYSIVCYHVLACGEIASNYARYDGLQYGHRATGKYTEELYARSRNEGFNETVRERIMAGNYFLLRKNYNTYYDKALRVRRLISNDFRNVFGQGIDVLLTPTTIGTAPLHSDFKSQSNSFQCKQHDVYTQPSNLAGVPAVSLPVSLSENCLPIGLQFIADTFREDVLLKAAKFLEIESSFRHLQLDF